MSDVSSVNVDLSELSVEQLKLVTKQANELKRQKMEEERAAKPPTKRGRGVLETTKKILLHNPNIDSDELYKMITEQCGSCSRTVMEAVRTDFKHTLRVIDEAGLLKKPDEVKSEPAPEEHPPEKSEAEEHSEGNKKKGRQHTLAVAG